MSTTPLLAFVFATPWLALLAAAGAAAIPIVIHLLHRNRYRIVDWAAMRFLLAAQRKNAKRMRLEQWILLAVRTLLVLLLVLAMASVMPWSEVVWGRLFSNRVALASLNSRRTHKILVLDGSLSMGVRQGDATCFDRARAMAAKYVRAGTGGDGFSVVLMAAPPRLIVSEPSEDAHKVAEEVQHLRLQHGNADFAGTLQSVENILSRSPGKFEEKEIYFFTDLQRATWTARQSVDPMIALQRIQTIARTAIVDVGQDGVNNLAVISLALNAPLATTGSETALVATVHNYGAEGRQGVRVELLASKARGNASESPFQLRPVGAAFIDIAPSQTTAVHFNHKFSQPGEYAVQVRIENDALDLDDGRSAVITVKEAVPVMLVNGKAAPEPLERATEFLHLALNPYEKEPAPRGFPIRPKVVSESQFGDAGLGDLTGFDCVFLCDVARLSLAEVRRLETHLASGGGVVFCLGPHIDFESYNRLLFRNAHGLLPARLLGVQQAPAERAFTLYADEENYKRPPLDAFASDRDRSSLMFARFRRYVRTEPVPGGRARKVLSFMPDAPAPADGGASKEPLPAGDPAILEWQPPAGKDRGRRLMASYRGPVVLLTSTVNMDWTTWPISPSFPAMMQELLRFAIAGRLREQAVLVGDPLEEFLPLGSAGLEVALVTPEGRNEATQTHDRDDACIFAWADTYSSGVYRATLGANPREHLFAVNVPVATETQQTCESDLTRTNREELRSTYPGWDFQIVTDPVDVIHAGGYAPSAGSRLATNLGPAVARWALLTMVALLTFEVLLAWVFGRYSAAPTNADASPAAIRTAGIVPAVLLLCCGGIAVVLVHAAWTGDVLGFLPDRFRGNVEGALGIPPPAPGEGSHWRLDFSPYLWNSGADPWLAGALALALTTLVIAVYRWEGPTANLRYKLMLAGLRIAFVLLTLAVLLPQLRLWFERQGWPDVAIVIDDSRSMSASDNYQDPHLRDAADFLGKSANLPAPQRLQLVQALLAGQSDWLRELFQQRKVKVHIYHCSGRAARLGDLADISASQQHSILVQAVRDLRAEGESSELGAAVRQVLNDFRGSSLSAIVMLTDGVTTEGDDLLKGAHYARQAGVPLFFIGVGDSHEIRDLQVHDLQVEDSVYVSDRVIFEARLTGQGYTDLTVPVTLKEKGSDKVLASEMVKVDPHGKPVKFRLTHQPAEPGERTYIIEAPVQPDELKSGDNNRIERMVFVREAKLIKVLYVEGAARYEYRFIKHLLERESAEDKRNKSVDLKVLLLDADEEYAKQDKSALVEFPTKADLNLFDVVILGDADPNHPKLGEKRLGELAEFVRERGGGLLMIAGEESSPNAYRETPLKDVLPVEITGPAPEEVERRESYRPELTALGRFHPIFRFTPGEAENQTVWNRLAELFWWSEGHRAKRAAEVLAVHPRIPAARGQVDNETPERQPLVLQQFVGAGRCMFFGMNETWRWRFREHEVRFNQFWIQTVRYLARSRLGRIELRLDRQSPYRRGEPIKVMVRFPDDAPPPAPQTEVNVFVERTLAGAGGVGGTEGQTLSLSKVEGSRATYEAVLTRTPEGEYRFWLSAPAVTGPKPRAECRVLVPPGEMDRLRMNQQEMERAAEQTQGRFYTIADFQGLLDDLPSGSRVTLNSPQPPHLLWNHTLMYALALALLGTEWFLRKRRHLL